MAVDFNKYLIKAKETVDIPKIIRQLELAQIVLDEKGLVDYTANLVFRDGLLHAGNDKMLIISPVDLKLNFAINGFDFYKAISGIKEEAELMLAKAQLLINSKKVKAELATWEAKESLAWLDNVGIDGGVEWQTLPEDFWEGINWCQFSISKDISVRALTCLRVLNDRILTTDGFRVSRFIMKGDTGVDILIPKENLTSLTKFPGLTEFSIVIQNDNPTWGLFRNPESGLICGTRLVIGLFPAQIESFFDSTGETITMPAELKEQVNRAGKFAEGTIDETTIISISMGNKLIRTTSTKATGTLEQELESDYDGEPIVFNTMPALFEQILSKVNKISICDGFLLFDVGEFSHILQIRSNEKPQEVPTDDVPF